MNEFIQVFNLNKTYRNIRAVNDLNLSLPQGKIITLLGSNGSGKTTFMRMLSGLVTPTAGKIVYENSSTVQEAKDYVAHHLSYMPQKFNLYDELSVIENINFVATIKNIPNKDETITHLMTKFSLDNYRNHYAANLSGGWRQKLSFVVALLTQPKILILDEPTAGVDVLGRQLLWNELSVLNQSGVTILLSTHFMDEIERSDYVCYLNAGRLIYFDTPTKLVDTMSLKSWHIHADRPQDFIIVLKQAFPHMNIDWISSTIHIRTQNATLDQINELYRFVNHHQNKIEDVKPSVQDAFILMTRQRSNHNA